MIERLINEQVTNDSQIKNMLTAYNEAAAFFYQKSPQDGDTGWVKPCYPRADFNIDMRYDPERKTAGTLIINVWCSTECSVIGGDDPDKAIEKRLVELIDGTFYTGDDKATICAVWNRSDAFDFERRAVTDKQSEPEVFGITLTFDLTEFPVQITTTPDPVLGVNTWVKSEFPQVVVISCDDMPPVWKPTDENPAIYWRFVGMESGNRQSYAVTWYTGRLAAHVIAKSVTERNKWIKAVVERLQQDGEVTLEDGSPMFINTVTVRHNADPLRDGQLEATGTYGVPEQHRKEGSAEPLAKPYFNF